MERWHDLADLAGPPLHVFLGLTAAEYSLWVYDPGALPIIRMARQSGQSLADVVAGLDRAESLPDDTRRNGLRIWLAQHVREATPA